MDETRFQFLVGAGISVCDCLQRGSYVMGNGALSLGVRWPGVTLTSHLHLGPRLGMPGAIPPSPDHTFITPIS